MMLGQKKQQEGEGQGWLTTFGDMVTLLFTFFVLVYSFCSYQPGEWESAVHSIKGALAVIPGTKGNLVYYISHNMARREIIKNKPL